MVSKWWRAQCIDCRKIWKVGAGDRWCECGGELRKMVNRPRRRKVNRGRY